SGEDRGRHHAGFGRSVAGHDPGDYRARSGSIGTLADARKYIRHRFENRPRRSEQRGPAGAERDSQPLRFEELEIRYSAQREGSQSDSHKPGRVQAEGRERGSSTKAGEAASAAEGTRIRSDSTGRGFERAAGGLASAGNLDREGA